MTKYQRSMLAKKAKSIILVLLGFKKYHEEYDQ